jgi:hypothetical protein
MAAPATYIFFRRWLFGIVSFTNNQRRNFRFVGGAVITAPYIGVFCEFRVSVGRSYGCASYLYIFTPLVVWDRFVYQ